MRNRKMDPCILVSVVCVAVALICATPARAADCPETVKDAAQVSITLDFDKMTITVSPDPVTIHMNPKTGEPGAVCWVVQDMGVKQTVMVEAKPEQPDMFSTDKFPMTKTSYYAESGKPSQAGTWNYSVKVIQDGVKDPIMTLDPQVVVDMGGP